MASTTRDTLHTRSTAAPSATQYGSHHGTLSDDVGTVLNKRMSVGAVLAGIILALVAHLLLNMAGVGAGLLAIDPMGGDNPDATTFSIAAAAWWAIAGIIASYLGGLAAGRLSGRPDASTAGWHGLIAWAGTTLVIAWLASSAVSSAVSGATSMVGSAFSGIGQTLGAAVPAVSSATDGNLIEQQLDRLTGAAANDPEAMRQELANTVRQIVTGDEAEAEAARNRAVDLIARMGNIPPEEARARLQEVETQAQQTLQQAEETARQAAETAANTTSTAALASAVALLLGAIAGYFGGRQGTPRHEVY